MTYTPLPPVPEEFKILSMMNNIGAISVERSLTPEELSMWTGIEAGSVRDSLKRLEELGYVQHTTTDGIEKFHITKIGMMKVLTLYS